MLALSCAMAGQPSHNDGIGGRRLAYARSRTRRPNISSSMPMTDQAIPIWNQWLEGERIEWQFLLLTYVNVLGYFFFNQPIFIDSLIYFYRFM